MKKLTQSRLMEVLSYNQETGNFYWKNARQGIKKGMLAGHKSKIGYQTIGVDKKPYYAHRLAWLYVNGYLPEHFIDHINRNKNDNRIVNLREASQSCNMRNCHISKSNTSGVTGVSWKSSNGKYVARVTIACKEVYVGVYEHMIDAVKARLAAEIKHGYPNCNTTSSAYEYIKRHDPEYLK